MLWIGVCEAVCVAAIGGLFGGFVMALGHRANEKFNMKMMEDYWNADIKRLESRLEVLDQKLSTISVNKAVVNVPGHRQGKSYNHQRPFNQRG
jgi:hypothetical protein